LRHYSQCAEQNCQDDGDAKDERRVGAEADSQAIAQGRGQEAQDSEQKDRKYERVQHAVKSRLQKGARRLQAVLPHDRTGRIKCA